jgi:hypothetical protein
MDLALGLGIFPQRCGSPLLFPYTKFRVQLPMISCHCPHCHAHYELAAEVEFHKVRCAECQGAFIAPEDGSVHLVALVAQDSKPVAAAVSAPVVPAESTGASVTKSSVARPPMMTPRRSKHSIALVFGSLIAVAGAGLLLQKKFSDSSPAGNTAAGEVPDVTLPADPAFASAAPTERASDYPAALERAKVTGNDILVLQRGSDWNLLGERIFRDLWQQESFVNSLGNGFILVTVDRQDKLGAPGMLDTSNPAGMEAFESYTKDLTTLPPDQITALKTESGLSYVRRGDTAWLVKGDPKNNPSKDVLTATVRATAGSQLLRLDFPPDESLPNKCAGRAANGNFVISEIQAHQGAAALPLVAAWSDHSEAAMPASHAIDAKSDLPDNCWNASAHTQKNRTLLLALQTPLTGGEITVQIICKSKHAQHIPGCLRIATVTQSAMVPAFIRYGALAALAQKNAAFDWNANWSVPRVALLDKEGRSIASEDKPRPPQRPSTLAQIARDLRAKRVLRDAVWARAEKAAGPEKAELLRQGLDILKLANSTGNGKRYKPVHDAMRAADPEDKSGAIRWLGFGGDPKSGVPGAKPAWNEALDTNGGKVTLTDANYQEALARVDKELADPRNSILPNEYRQRIMLAKYHIYKKWKGHEDERFNIQREIAAMDPTTFWGIGGAGYLGEYGRSANPYLSYGWKPGQVKSGLQTWTITDTAYFFAQAVPHSLKLSHTSGKDTLRIKRIALMDGSSALAECLPDRDLGPGPNAKLLCELDCRAWKPDTKYTMLVDFEAAEGKTDSVGTFSVEPLLVEPESTVVSTEWSKRQLALLTQLRTVFASGDPSAKVNDPATRKDLATWELLRRCADAVDKIAARPGGAAMLEKLTGDPDWLESMLTTDNNKWEQTLENLRFLHHNCAGFDHPVYRKMGTAMAMQAGTMNRYRLQDRFKHTQKVHQDGLMHAKFDSLTIREMNWAVLLSGTTADFQFMVDEMQTTWADYIGACWGIPYIDPNVYGYSVQGWGYVDPWVHHYGNGTGDRPYRVQRQVGGVCGTLSGYGSAAARAHGVMATTVGQPGHCAYVVRVGDSWQTGNDVSGPETNGASVFEGTTFASMHRLLEAIHADQTQLRMANRLAWVAHLLQDADPKSPVHFTPEWFAASKRALAAQPINYPIWLETIKALEADPKVPASVWQETALAATKAFAPWHEAGWALADRCLAKVMPSLPPADRIKLLMDGHTNLRQINAPHFFGYNFSGVLSAQAAMLKEVPAQVDFFKQLLRVHHSTDSKFQRLFGEVMAWGQKTFGDKPATAPLFVSAMGEFFATPSGAADSARINTMVTTGLRKSAELGDKASNKLWSDMAAKLLPPLKPADIGLTEAQLTSSPKVEPFPGSLLGDEALLRTSSASANDRLLSYRNILTGAAPGFFETNPEDKPWAQVQLAGDCELSGINIVNRYESPADSDRFIRSFPLKVSVSTDGKAWTDVALLEQPAATLRVDLQGKVPQAKFIRLEHQPISGKPATKLQLRNVLVYGRKLY